MKIFQLLCMAMGAVAVAAGYNSLPSTAPTPTPNVTPDRADATIEIITKPDENIPSAPANQGLIEAVSPLQAILKGQPADALLLARVSRQWADFFSRETTPWKTTKEFQEAYLKSTILCLDGTPIAGKYHGAIDDVLHASMLAAFKTYNLSDSAGLKPVAWDGNCRNAARDASNAISWACYTSFGNSTLESQP